MSGAKDFPDFIKALPEIEIPYPGCRGYLIQGTDQQVVFVGFERTTAAPSTPTPSSGSSSSRARWRWRPVGGRGRTGPATGSSYPLASPTPPSCPRATGR